MKRSHIKLLCCLLCVCTVFSNIAIPSYAAFDVTTNVSSTGEDWTIQSDPSGFEYLLNIVTGEKIVRAFTYNEEGLLVEISLEECLQIKKSSPSVNAIPAVDAAVNSVDYGTEDASTLRYETVMYNYQETSTYQANGTPVKVSADSKGPASISYFISQTISCSFGGNISLTTAYKNAISSGASFSWNNTLSSQVQNGYTYPVPSGRTGYIRFTPYMNVTTGNLYQIYISSYGTEEKNLGTVWGYSPKALSNGIADGLYELVII